MVRHLLSFVYPFIIMSSLLPVAYVRNRSGTHVTLCCIYTQIGERLFTCDLCKKSVKKSPVSWSSILLTPWCTVLLEKLTGLQLVNKFPAFHRARRFVTALTSVRQLSLSWGTPTQSTSHLLEIHPNIIHPSMPSSAQWLFTSVFPTQTLYTPLSSPIYVTCQAHLILLDFITHTLLVRSTDHLAPH